MSRLRTRIRGSPSVGFDCREVSGIKHAWALSAAKTVRLEMLNDIRRAPREHLARGGTLRMFERQPARSRPVLSRPLADQFLRQESRRAQAKPP